MFNLKASRLCPLKIPTLVTGLKLRRASGAISRHCILTRRVIRIITVVPSEFGGKVGSITMFLLLLPPPVSIKNYGRDKSSDLQFHVRVTCNYDDSAKKQTQLSSPQHCRPLFIYSAFADHLTEPVSHRATDALTNYSLIDGDDGQRSVCAVELCSSQRISFQPVERVISAGLTSLFIVNTGCSWPQVHSRRKVSSSNSSAAAATA